MFEQRNDQNTPTSFLLNLNSFELKLRNLLKAYSVKNDVKPNEKVYEILLPQTRKLYQDFVKTKQFRWFNTIW